MHLGIFIEIYNQRLYISAISLIKTTELHSKSIRNGHQNHQKSIRVYIADFHLLQGQSNGNSWIR